MGQVKWLCSNDAYSEKLSILSTDSTVVLLARLLRDHSCTLSLRMDLMKHNLCQHLSCCYRGDFG